jgi:hypothetical protein
MQNDDKCPRCSESESAVHVWQCRGEEADEVWDKSMSDLRIHLRRQNTDQDLREALLLHLNNWRYGTPPHLGAHYSETIREAIQDQNGIGWKNFLEGCASRKWAPIQDAHYKMIGKRTRGKRWISSLILKLWQTAWNQWEHRNGVLHRSVRPRDAVAIAQLDTAIAEEMRQGRGLLPRRELYHFEYTVQELLEKPLDFKKAWYDNVRTARARADRTHNLVTGNKFERRFMEEWLRTGRMREI